MSRRKVEVRGFIFHSYACTVRFRHHRHHLTSYVFAFSDLLLTYFLFLVTKLDVVVLIGSCTLGCDFIIPIF